MKFLTALSAIALVATPVAVSAKDKNWPELGVESRIAFANHGGIRDFRADGDYGLWIQDNKKRWYYAALSGRCSGLGFANTIGFETFGMSDFDRSSSIHVEGMPCYVTSLVTAEKPVSGKELKLLQDEVRKLGRSAFADS